MVLYLCVHRSAFCVIFEFYCVAFNSFNVDLTFYPKISKHQTLYIFIHKTNLPYTHKSTSRYVKQKIKNKVILNMKFVCLSH